MEAREPISLRAMNSEGVGLQVQFLWRLDRHCHTISLLVNGRSIPVLESVEGSSTEVWPPSPPLQQLSVEELRPKTQVALLVGMAGKSHWSISVDPISDRAAFVFDVACRSREVAEQLGSAYKLLVDEFTSTGDHDATIDIEGHSLQIHCDQDGPTTAAVKKGLLGPRIEPVSLSPTGTTRWRYTIELK
ncbi:MAG: hypothetical protein H6821_09880 [Planctomycetaceae bacterium]|nr:hypothetical protein [Planctomycetales bacterium]MCB9874472.1 hypothetical protein [Planctomycetaceae bacterium]MCB9940951.1 hypothetical protein [Planctomycetaceae bacterium]HRX79231.1 hypothetical protein [Pirellulaceae bacterium]